MHRLGALHDLLAALLRRLLLGDEVVDHVLGGLHPHVAAVVEALPPGAPGDGWPSPAGSCCS